jgi:hypothetical protein
LEIKGANVDLVRSGSGAPGQAMPSHEVATHRPVPSLSVTRRQDRSTQRSRFSNERRVSGRPVKWQASNLPAEETRRSQETRPAAGRPKGIGVLNSPRVWPP